MAKEAKKTSLEKASGKTKPENQVMKDMMTKEIMKKIQDKIADNDTSVLSALKMLLAQDKDK